MTWSEDWEDDVFSSGISGSMQVTVDEERRDDLRGKQRECVDGGSSSTPSAADTVHLDFAHMPSNCHDREIVLASVELEKRRLEYKLEKVRMAKLGYQRDSSHVGLKQAHPLSALEMGMMEDGVVLKAQEGAAPVESTDQPWHTYFYWLTAASAGFTILCLIGSSSTWSGELCVSYQVASRGGGCSNIVLPRPSCSSISRILAGESAFPEENVTATLGAANTLRHLTVGDYTFGTKLTNFKAEALSLSESNGAILSVILQILLLLVNCATPVIAQKQSFQIAKYNAVLGTILAIASFVYFVDRGPSAQLKAALFADSHRDAASCGPEGMITLRPGWTWGWVMNMLSLCLSIVAIAIAHFADQKPRTQYTMVDPIAHIFSYAPAAWGNVSYGQYVLQIICYNIWPIVNLGITVVPFFIFLLSLSWLSAELVTDPARSWWLKQKGKVCFRMPKLVFMPLWTAVLLLSISVPYRATRSAAAVVRLAKPYVRGSNASDGAALFVDVRLNWTAPEFGDDERALINPSIAVIEPSDNLRIVLRVARAHAALESVSEGSWVVNTSTNEARRVTIIKQEWRSDIVIAKDVGPLDLSGWSVATWGLDGNAPMQRKRILPTLDSTDDSESWGPLCEAAPTFIPQNNTLVRKVVTGPEDPKLLMLAENVGNVRWGITFSSLPPIATNPQCYQGGSRVEQGQEVGVTHMYIAPETRAGGEISAPSAEVIGSRLQCGRTDQAEKNWIGFMHRGQLHYVYSVYPHKVVIARSEDGGCDDGVQETEFPALKKLAQDGKRLHGSATAIPYYGAYLALLHSIDSDGNYETFAYRFEAELPFRILEVSRPLPLQGEGKRNFASGLYAGSGKVMVSYGEKDAAARALVMSEHFLESLFLRHLDPNSEEVVLS